MVAAEGGAGWATVSADGDENDPTHERAEAKSDSVNRTSLHVGDVFRVPLDDRRYGLGQVVGAYEEHAYFFALFEPAFSADDQPHLEQAMTAPVALLALSLDARIAAGDSVCEPRP